MSGTYETLGWDSGETGAAIAMRLENTSRTNDETFYTSHWGENYIILFPRRLVLMNQFRMRTGTRNDAVVSAFFRGIESICQINHSFHSQIHLLYVSGTQFVNWL